MIKLTLDKQHPVNEAIIQLEFKSSEKLIFSAGQYLELIIEGESNLYFTIASSPLEDHIILLVENRTATLIKEHCGQQGFVYSKPAAGFCHIDNIPQDCEQIILVAAGSGFSQMRAICQEVMLRPINKKVIFIWGNDSIFEEQLIKSWVNNIDVKLPHIVDDEDKHKNLLDYFKQQNFQNLANSAVIACGSPNMVYPLLDDLCQNGLNENNMLADVFQFIPR